MKASILLLFCQSASAFVLLPQQLPVLLPATRIQASYGRDDDDDHYERDVYEINKARTSVGNFLTQRAIQSFMFLLTSCRDPHTVRWLEDTYQLQNIGYFHGTGGLNLTLYREWDTLLHDMLERPKDVVVVKTRQTSRGLSKNNPFYEEHWVNLDIDIDPVSLVSRILSVREQIAHEWVTDLNTVRVANDMILDSYYNQSLASRQDDTCDDLDDPEDCLDVEDLVKPYSDPHEQPSTKAKQSSAKSSKSSSGSKPKEETKTKPKQAFDRSARMMLENSLALGNRDSSPYRKGSFDLLCLLVTQEAVHRILRNYKRDEDREVSFAWLREFYTQRLESHFDGNQQYGRADDFLEELLTTPPSTKELEDGRGMVGLIDPLRIADDIITMRSQVAADWKEIVAAAPEDHMVLRKHVLSKQMANAVNPSPFAIQETSAIEEEVETTKSQVTEAPEKKTDTKLDNKSVLKKTDTKLESRKGDKPVETKSRKIVTNKNASKRVLNGAAAAAGKKMTKQEKAFLKRAARRAAKQEKAKLRNQAKHEKKKKSFAFEDGGFE